jgi:phospholipid/cholesterol/gamma-HCH transport system substrate-binding protein
MAITRSQKVRLGIFVGAGGAILVAGLVLLAGMKLGEKRDRYRVRFSDANLSLSGLEVGAPVKYSGVRVGRVDAIRVDPADVSVIEVTLSLQGGTPVAEDSQASAASMGITGLKYIELSRGSRTARIRAPGETIPAGQSLMDELTDRAAAISNKLDALIDNLHEFTTPDMRDRVAGVLDNANRLLQTADATVVENRANLQQTFEKIGQASVQVEALTREIRATAEKTDALLDRAGPRVDQTLAEAQALVAELRRTREQLDGVLGDARATLRVAQAALGEEGAAKAVKSIHRVAERGYLVLAQSQEEIDAALGHLKETSENLSAFSQRIKENPSLLILGGVDRGGGREGGDR